jgi:hypothetical protein
MRATPLYYEPWPPNAARYLHDGHECLVWHFAGEDKLSIQCPESSGCQATPVEVADTLGIDRSLLSEWELAISARMLAERVLAEDPEHPVAVLTLAILGT